MPATCPSCSWPKPEAVSTHGAVRYLRCVCGQWLVCVDGTIVATPGGSGLESGPVTHTGAPARAELHLPVHPAAASPGLGVERGHDRCESADPLGF